MFIPWFARLGNWNAQLFRELKGRLKLRTVLGIVAVAVLGQALVMGLFASALPGNGTSLQYCDVDPNTYECLLDDQGVVIVFWQVWWQDVLHFLNWVVMLLLTVPGVYLLAQDLEREEDKGTLNFIRLSPQSARSVLLGKLLGVPILFYIAVALLLPLHSMAAQGAGAPGDFLVSFYLLFGAGSIFSFSVAMLFGFLSKLQTLAGGGRMGSGVALLMVVANSALFVPAYFFWNLSTAWNHYLPFLSDAHVPQPSQIRWFFLNIGEIPILGHGFTLINLGILTGLIWQAMERCYSSPGKTLLSKTHSYGLVVYLEVLALGFCIYPWNNSDTLQTAQFMALSMLNLGLMVGAIALFCNHRQALLDWARFRHLQTHQNQGQAGRRQGRSLLSDLLWGEKSPASVAIALNLLLMAGFMAIWMLFNSRLSEFSAHLAGMVLGQVFCLLTLALYGAIAQLLLLMKNPRRILVALVSISVLAILPIMVGNALRDYGLATSGLRWLVLFSPVPLPFVFEEAWFLSLGTILGGLVAHISLLSVLHLQLVRQLKRLGSSSSQALLQSARQS